ncbi:Uncharacterised protein [Candidatus Bilamarchaeum dharawalense]|uniref:Uncharacterized protein n=1 Tax=Candidatus Bilamarchaeum dharawalense TaxID=2885759 RepID=A0A5E4LQM4_9ARCH|nr:Uncharacterised protein [Candidatus Bilamarchaeum dharawalense]
MGCFIAPAVLGIFTTIFRKKFPKNWHVNWLNTMILGGMVVLGIDHVASGELVPWPPFLTAMSNPAGVAVLINEILTIGIPMAIALVLLWVGMVIVYEKVLLPKKVPSSA